MTKTVGIIAEDDSDVSVIRTLLKKLSGAPFGIKKFSGDGSSKVRNKCGVWAGVLRDRGCSILIVVHDLDRNNYATLLAELTAALNPCPIRKYAIVIPIREIEAWLLSDRTAISRTFALKRPLRDIANPESIANPKEYLGESVRKASQNRKFYVNTIHNTKIAEKVTIGTLMRCPSFGRFATFVHANI